MIAETQLHRFIQDLEAQRPYNLLTHLIHIEFHIVEFERSGFDLRQIENVGNQLQQQFVIFLNNGYILPSFVGIFGFSDQIRKADDGIQWRADFMAHISQKSRFQTIAHFGFVLRFDQILLRFLQLGNVVIDTHHFDLRRIVIQGIAHHIDTGPLLSSVRIDPKIMAETVDLAGFHLSDGLQNFSPVGGIDMFIHTEDLIERRILLLAQVIIPLRHAIPLFRNQVEATVSDLAETTDQRKRAFELRDTTMRPIDFRIVDIDQEEIAHPPLRIVKHTHRTVYFEAALLGGNIITVQTIEGIIRLERELLPVPHPAPDLLVENGILEKIDPEHILLVPNPENLQILVIQIDEQAVPVVQFDTDGNIVINITQ